MAEFTLTYDTPIGPMTATLTPRGVRSLRFPDTPALLEIAPSPPQCIPPVAPGLTALDDATRRHAESLQRFLAAYFNGAPSPPAVQLDLDGATRFQQQVWQALRRVGPAQTVSYGELARRIGRPHAARAIGQAMRRNPLVLVVPCHRVLASGHRLGGFSGGLGLKAWLLEFEGAAPRSAQIA